MTEPTKTEGDDIGLPDQPSKPQDYETSSVQAAQPPQTATDPDKYRKLKSKFSMLRKVCEVLTKKVPRVAQPVP